jgi:hypothetical protein
MPGKIGLEARTGVSGDCSVLAVPPHCAGVDQHSWSARLGIKSRSAKIRARNKPDIFCLTFPACSPIFLETLGERIVR